MTIKAIAIPAVATLLAAAISAGPGLEAKAEGQASAGISEQSVSEAPISSYPEPEESYGSEETGRLDEIIEIVKDKLDGIDATAAIGTGLGSLISAAVSALFWLIYRKRDKIFKESVEGSAKSSSDGVEALTEKVKELTALVEKVVEEKDKAIVEIGEKYGSLVEEVTEKSREAYEAFSEAASKLDAYSNTEARLTEIERLIRVIAESPLGVKTGLATEVGK